MTVVLSLALVAVLVIAAGRYGADTRTGPDPTGRDAAWPARPSRSHSPIADLRALRVLTRLWAGQVRAQRAFDRHLRPWETRSETQTQRGELTPRW